MKLTLLFLSHQLLLERKGSIKYSFSSGEYDGNNNGDGRYVNEAEIYYGLTDFVTVFGGALYAKNTNPMQSVQGLT